MSAQTLPRRFVLLVGIDLYLRGSRNSQYESVPQLAGCVNDVTAMKNLLSLHFRLERVKVLTSSPTAGSDLPVEPQDQWPTYENILKEFDYISNEAHNGDLFFFQFAGHGELLDCTVDSPPGRKRDPSLLPVDFCTENCAIRGWQLNKRLEELHQKGIQIVVVLDSFYSAKTWRGKGQLRRPTQLSRVLENEADKAVTQEHSRGTYRDADLAKSWDINPKGFTLMAACRAHELAREDKADDGKVYGSFTLSILKYFKSNDLSKNHPRYCEIRDWIAQYMKEQTPEIYGLDKLLFFESFEPLFTVSLVVRTEMSSGGNRIAVIPLGEIHGVCKNAEFEAKTPAFKLVLKISEVKQLECRANISVEDERKLQQVNNIVTPLRWCLGTKALRISTSAQLGNAFQVALQESLQSRITNQIIFTQFDDNHGPDAGMLGLRYRDDKSVNVFGPESLIGYGDHLRGLDLRGKSTQDLAEQSATALSHLARFEQILDLRTMSSQESADFKVSVEPTDAGSDTGPFPDGQEFLYKFENAGSNQLHFTVLCLSPAFRVYQFYPTSDLPQSVDPHQSESFSFKIGIPTVLKRICGNDNTVIHQDIIRTIVTTNKKVSWRSLELPEIQNAGCPENKSGAWRDVILVKKAPSVQVWVKDTTLLTRCQ